MLQTFDPIAVFASCQLPKPELIGSTDIIQVPTSSNPQAFTFDSKLSDLLLEANTRVSIVSMLAALVWHPIESAGASDVGLVLQVATEGWVSVWDPFEGALEALGIKASLFHYDSEDKILYVDLKMAEKVVVDTEHNHGLVLGWIENQIYLAAFGRKQFHISEPESIDVNVAEFEKLGSVDSWLLDQVREQLLVKSAWNTAVAVGMVGRLRRDSEEVRQRIADALRRGEEDPLEMWSWNWAKSLSEAQIKTLRQLLFIEWGLFEDELRELERWLMDEDEVGWVADEVKVALRILLQRRDNMESVRCILDAVGHTDLAARFEDIDRRGERVAKACKGMGSLMCEHLNRVAEFNPVAWWGMNA